MKPLVLASSSPRRRRLLRELGVGFSVRVADLDECPLPGELPEPHVRRLALAKARAVARELAPGCGAQWVLGADTVVVLDERILGKPRDAGDARGMLARLSGRTHEVLTGVALVPVSGGRARTSVVRSRVEMKPFDAVTIRRYVAGGEPLDKAGSYAVQGRGRHLVARVSGSLTNVIGLPVERLRSMLAAAGIPQPVSHENALGGGVARRGGRQRRDEVRTMRKCQPSFSGARSDRGPNETVSPQSKALPIDKRANGRVGWTVRSDRTPQPARTRNC